MTGDFGGSYFVLRPSVLCCALWNQRNLANLLVSKELVVIYIYMSSCAASFFGSCCLLYSSLDLQTFTSLVFSILQDNLLVGIWNLVDCFPCDKTDSRRVPCTRCRPGRCKHTGNKACNSRGTLESMSRGPNNLGILFGDRPFSITVMRFHEVFRRVMFY